MTELLFRSADGRFGLTLDAGRVARLLELCREAGLDETGGILVGRYSYGHDCAHVISIVRPPADSAAGRTLFRRGVAGLNSWLQKLWGATREHYIGEWHFHPLASPDPSSIDREQMLRIATDRAWGCPEPVLLIIGGDPAGEWRAHAEVATRQGRLIPLQLQPS